jgi:asparagine synthase (glutamine-hydrolysing)
MASQRFGTDHTKFLVEAGAVDLVDELLHQHDEPFGDSSAIPTYIVSRLTGEHVTVALTGDAGDELFAGYLRFLGARLAESIPGPIARLGDSIGRRLPYNENFRSLSRRTARFFAAAALPAEERTLRWIGFFGDRLDELLRPELRDLLSRAEITRSFREPLERTSDLSPLARALALNFETYLPDDLLVKADRCSMAHGLELRAPFLDRELMEYAAALPDRLKIRGRSLKHVLKEAFRDLLPAEIRGRAKMGFGVPLPIWFRTHWRPLVEDFLLADDARIRDWIEPGPVRKMAEAHFREEADYGHQLWALLTLEKWLRKGKFSMPS